MNVFPHGELTYYAFGVRAGVANLTTNGLRLGLKKTVGKITQPVNAYTRFAEYRAFDRAVREFQHTRPPDPPIAVLDVGSPKLFGLYLAAGRRAAVTLTDISPANIDEYRVMWRGLEAAARGTAEFSLQDARRLEYADEAFDVVYSMSVVEHIDGDRGDSAAVREMLRVLRPGGLFLLSVPFGRTFMDQHRVGFAGAAEWTGDAREYFFQRIYDRRAFQERILDAASELGTYTVGTVARQRTWLARNFGRLPDNARGALGCLNPLLSAAISRVREGVDDGFPVCYGRLHEARDVYGDLILSGRKRLSHD